MITEIKIMTFHEIKKVAGNTWALIADPVYSDKDGNLKSGYLLFFHQEKEKVHQYVLKEGSESLQHYTIIFTGELPKDQIFELLCNFSTQKRADFNQSINNRPDTY